MKQHAQIGFCSIIELACAGMLLLLGTNVRAQNLFVADEDSGNIYEYTPTGVRSTFAMGLSFPTALAFDSSGNLFVACAGGAGGLNSGSIIKITPNGVESAFALGLDRPFGLAFNDAGNLFVSVGGNLPDPSTGEVLEFTPSGAKSVFTSGLQSPAGLAFNSTEDLFVGDDGSGGVLRGTDDSITEITPAGVKNIFVTGFSNSVDGLTFNNSGNLYAATFGLAAGNGRIVKITPEGTTSTIVSSLDEPRALAFDGAGDLFVANSGGNDIIEIAPDGVQTIFASNLDFPFGLAFQPVSEPSVLGLLGAGIMALFVCFNCNRRTMPC